MGVKIHYTDNKVEHTNAAWVDVIYGNDSSGVIDRRDKPFATIEAAFTAMGAANKRNCTFYISKGNHTLTNRLDVQTAFGNGNINMNFVCEGEPYQTIITSTSVNQLFRMTSNGTRNVTFKGGTWIRNSATANYMFDISSSPNSRARFVGMNIEDLLSTGGIFIQRTTDLIEDCLVTGNNNPQIFLTSGTTESEIKVIKSLISCPTGNIMGGTSGTIRAMFFEGCVISAPVGRFTNTAAANANVSLTFKDCLITIQGTGFEGRTLAFRAENTRITTSTNGRIIDFNTSTGNNLTGTLIADGLIFNQPVTATGACVERSGSGVVRAFPYGNGITYLQGHRPTPGSVFSNVPPVSSPNGKVGFRLEPTVTIGSTITVNLTNLSTAGYNSAPIAHLVASSDPAVVTAAIKALIDAQVIIPGTPWNLWTQGDTGLVDITNGGRDLSIYAHPLAPGNFGINTTVNYTSSTVPTDITTDLNVTPNGIINVTGGDMNPLPKIPYDNTNTVLPISLARPSLKLRIY